MPWNNVKYGHISKHSMQVAEGEIYNNIAKFQTHLIVYVCSVYPQVWLTLKAKQKLQQTTLLFLLLSF